MIFVVTMDWPADSFSPVSKEIQKFIGYSNQNCIWNVVLLSTDFKKEQKIQIGVTRN